MTEDEMRALAGETAAKLKTPLLRESLHWPEPPYIRVFKAGVVPYRLGVKNIEYYLFKPKATKPEKGDPGFQIGKGTREIRNPETGVWEDYHTVKQLEAFGAENLEDVKVTALREGIEEIGLPVDEIVEAAEWGQAAFTSAATGNLKTMWLFTVGVEADCKFGEPDAKLADTVAREWFDLQNDEQVEQIRPDHLNILHGIDKVLSIQLEND